jgi:CRP/FNR family transcriptional regulator, cyclic AMP receptor protein
VSAAENLKLVPLFADLDGRQLKKLADKFRERTFQPGTSIVQEGTMSGVGFVVITEGEAGVHINGNPATTLSAGDHFGEIALANEVERTAAVMARTELRCLEIPFWDFREFALKSPDVTWKLLQHVVEVLSTRTAPAPA